MIRVFLFTLFISSLGFADSALLLSKDMNAQLNPGCNVVETPVPPFYMVRSDGTAAQGAPSGTLPQNTLVQIDNGNPDADALSSQGLLSVQVLSMPGAASAAGKNVVGTHVHIQNTFLHPATTAVVGALMEPGGELNIDARKTVFIVRRDSPFYNMPELRGKAVRLAQDAPHPLLATGAMGSNYFVKRCCSAQPTPTSLDAVYSQELQRIYETKPNPSCTYQPVFEVLDAAGTPDKPFFQFNGQFAIPAADNACRSFEAALTPAGSDSYDALRTTMNQFSRARDSLLNQMTSLFNNEIRSTDNKSTGKCRASWRRTMVAMGLLEEGEHPPTDIEEIRDRRGRVIRAGWHPASGLAPWLVTKKPTNFTDQTKNYNSSNAPAGCTLVYGGAGAGHVEAKRADGQYCSDYCRPYPRDSDHSGKRPLIGVYCPKAVL